MKPSLSYSFTFFLSRKSPRFRPLLPTPYSYVTLQHIMEDRPHLDCPSNDRSQGDLRKIVLANQANIAKNTATLKDVKMLLTQMKDLLSRTINSMSMNETEHDASQIPDTTREIHEKKNGSFPETCMNAD